MNDPSIMVAGEPVVFSIAGQRFKLKPLPCDRSLVGLDILQQSVAPFIRDLIGMIDFKKFESFVKSDSEGLPDILKDGKGDQDVADLLQKGLGLVGIMPKFYSLFAPYCDCFLVTNPESGTEVALAVSDSSSIFARRSSLCIAWILECIRIEYADFLSGTGLTLIWEAANRLKSHLGSDPKSG